MEEVIMFKVDQVKDFCVKLEIVDLKFVFVEVMFDIFWGMGLDVIGIKGINLLKWFGDNKLGFIVKKVVVVKCGRRFWSVLVLRKGNLNEDN